MERDNRTPRKNGSGNPLNVSARNERIEETRARVQGDTTRSRVESLAVSPNVVSSAGSSGQTEASDAAVEDAVESEDSSEIVVPEGNSCREPPEELGESNPVSSRPSAESDTRPGLSANVEWMRRNFERPLALAMRDMLARKPSDPVGFLASWLLNYRVVQEQSRMQRRRDRELGEERARIRKLSSVSSSKLDEEIETAQWGEESDDGEEIADPNYQNYAE